MGGGGGKPRWARADTEARDSFQVDREVEESSLSRVCPHNVTPLIGGTLIRWIYIYIYIEREREK